MRIACGAGIVLAIALTIHPASAQHHGAPPAAGARVPAGPYAGLERRAVKALSDEQVADLKAGRGMGLALTAELNGYPGPSHALELADALSLTDDQRSALRALFEAMKAETIPLGERLLADETVLDGLFATHQITPVLLDTTTSRIASLQGQLRSAHLRYHLATVNALSAAQIARYRTLRGYAAADGAHHPP